MSQNWTFSRIFSVLWSGVDGLRKVLHLLVLLFIFSILISALSSQTPSMPAKASLVIRPVGNLVDQLEGDAYERALAELLGEEQPQTRVQDIIDGLKFAKTDARISAVLLDLSAIGGGGFSKLQRIAAAIQDFRASGKPVIATADVYGERSYYLAAHADEVYLHPEGIFLMRGFGVYLNYFKRLLDKLKVDWHVFRVGTHKAAPEPFMRDSMSSEQRESLTMLLDQYWNRFKDDVVAARELEPGSVDDLLNNLIEYTETLDGDLAKLSVELGFVDQLMTREQLRARMLEASATEAEDDGTFPATGLRDYLAQMRLLDDDTVKGKNVAVIVAAGEILNGSQPPGTIGGDSTAALLQRARHDESVKAVVLQVDSPGGSSFASEVIRNEVVALKEAGKPVVVSMSSVAASGGYWISMAADRIFASEYTITGSIGIFFMFPTIHRSLDAIGISTDGVGSTFWAGELRADRELSDETRTMIRLLVEKGYDDFISKVALHRGIEKSEVDRIAQGQVWTGSDAIDRGLVDEIGNIDTAIVAAAELAGLEEGAYGKKYFEKELSPGEQLLLDFLSGARSIGILPQTLLQKRSSIDQLAQVLDRSIRPLLRMNDPMGVYSHCFCVFE
ncbi:MAG: signal peptide peptidase SppA [Woeseiaceae bacterium]|nr:signal peptide peptidase SppA [Woeseiaceae bacterium]